MARFEYLKGEKSQRKSGKKLKTPAPDESRGKSEERVEAVYVRKETVRAVWREVKKEGGESVSELVEDLLLRWLRERA